MKKISNELISSLLQKYFEADTSLKEEKLLRDYFRGKVHEQFVEYKPLFCCFANEIDKMNTIDVTGKTSSENPHKVSFRWMSVLVAACIAFAIYLSIPERGDTVRLMIDGVNISNQELAIAKTDVRLMQLKTILSKYKQSNDKLESLGRAQDAVSPLNDFSKLLKQNNIK